jgi:hypothetical protein
MNLSTVRGSRFHHLARVVAVVAVLGLQRTLPAGADDATPKLSPFMLSKSILNHGDLALFRRLSERLAAGQCLNVVIIGGSVSTGHYLPRPFNANATWHQILKGIMDARYPCRRGADPGQHKLTVLAKPGMPTAYWNELFAGHQDKYFHGANLILVDETINDGAVIADESHRKSRPQVILTQVYWLLHDTLLYQLLINVFSEIMSTLSVSWIQSTWPGHAGQGRPLLPLVAASVICILKQRVRQCAFAITSLLNSLLHRLPLFMNYGGYNLYECLATFPVGRCGFASHTIANGN